MDYGEKVRMRVPALEVEGLGTIFEQAGELGHEDGSRVPHGFQRADEGGDLGAEVVGRGEG